MQGPSSGSRRRPPVTAPPVQLARQALGAPEAPRATPLDDAVKLVPLAVLFPRARTFSFHDGEGPPQLLRALNHADLGPQAPPAPGAIQAVASAILEHARTGALIDEVFARDVDYAGFAGDASEAWARAVAERLTGIPLLDPESLYAEGRPAIARALFFEGRYPLAGRVQDAVTSALCLGGWSGGEHLDVGAGREGLERCDEVIPADQVELRLEAWPEDLWNRAGAGACLFWQDPADRRRGHVAMILRKHPQHAGDREERVIQLWGSAMADASGREPLPIFEEPQLTREVLPELRIGGGALAFCGIGLLRGLGGVRVDMRPRGRCRLLLRERNGGRKLLYRSAWLSMEAEGLSVARLLASLRGAAHPEEIEATWCVNSMCLTPTNDVPDNRPLLDGFNTTTGKARVRCDLAAGGHRRPDEDVEACSELSPYIAAGGEGAEF